MCFSGFQTRGIVINKSTVFTVTTSKPFILLLVFFFLFERSTSKCLSQSYEIVDLEWSVYWHSKRGRINFTFPHIRAVSSHDPVLHTIRWEEIELRTKPSLMAYAPWKEAIIKVKWADAERKSIFFAIINVVLNLTPRVEEPYLNDPPAPTTSTVCYNGVKCGDNTLLHLYSALSSPPSPLAKVETLLFQRGLGYCT